MRQHLSSIASRAESSREKSYAFRFEEGGWKRNPYKMKWNGREFVRRIRFPFNTLTLLLIDFESQRDCIKNLSNNPHVYSMYMVHVQQKQRARAFGITSTSAPTSFLLDATLCGARGGGRSRSVGVVSCAARLRAIRADSAAARICERAPQRTCEKTKRKATPLFA